MNRSAASASASAPRPASTRIASPTDSGDLLPPPPRRIRGEAVREIDRRHARPDPSGAAEVWNSRLGADARTGEYHSLARALDRPGELRDLMSDRHAGSLANDWRRAKPRVRSSH